MKASRNLAMAAGVAAVISVLVAAQLAQARPTAARTSAAPATSGCSLGANGSPVKHVIYLQFDNVHYRRDAAGVPSDLEQMPHLLNFLQNNGTLLTNDHTILISHTAGGILSSLTGHYPDRNGQTVTNAYGFFKPDGTIGFSSSFKYWTDQVDATFDPLPNMMTDGQKTTPAPWVPFTRAGCDVGGVGTANIELENTATNATGDMTPRVRGQLARVERGRGRGGSAERSRRCEGEGPAADRLRRHRRPLRPDRDERVREQRRCEAGRRCPTSPAATRASRRCTARSTSIRRSPRHQPCVNDTAGQPITDPAGTCGFPGFDGMLARNTLGYVEQMQENGVPVTYGYISDVHDAHAANPATDSYVSTATGPGEAAHDAQLKDYDDAFAAFFQNLAAHGIDKSNTLFVITVDEGDHFAGGAGIPQPDGTLQYAHTACAALNACPSNQIGEVNANVQALLPAGEPPFSIHSDDAPTFYVNGHPGPTDPTVRKLERDVAGLQAPDPYVGNGEHRADDGRTWPTRWRSRRCTWSTRTPTAHRPSRCSETTTSSSRRRIRRSARRTSARACTCARCRASPGTTATSRRRSATPGPVSSAPGVAQRGVDSQTWTDHTNLRPTILALTGLKDDYQHDGRVLVEALRPGRRRPRCGRPSRRSWREVYEQLNAPFGQFGQDTLAASTRAARERLGHRRLAVHPHRGGDRAR